ncbi:hypothetical protein [Marinobacterium aestuariivivens]|uniref:Restriction endonuclease n=1 Tax=Marinobacterium aestuariivivens TaxID=1698799 RepID=A0ABW2AA15_9GAMM
MADNFAVSEQLDPKLQPDRLDEAMVNAVESDSDAEERTLGTANWLISPPKAMQQEDAKRLLLGFITGVFVKSSKALGFEVEMKKDSDSPVPDVLMASVGGFELKVCSTFGENTLHPSTLEGAGEITSAHGHRPLLMMICLQERFQLEWPDVTEPLVTLCDEQGNTISYSNFNSLENAIERMGFDYETVRSDAVKLGLATEQVNWSEIQSDIENCFF